MKFTKKIAAIAACACMAMTSMVGMGAFATENANATTDSGITDVYTSNDLNYAKYISMTHYYQSGQSWSSQHCGGISSNPTIASAGCAITSFAMVEKYYGGSHNPGQVSTNLGSSAYPMDWYTAATAYGLSLPTIIPYSDNILDKGRASGTTCSYVRSNKPVIVGMKNRNTGGTHFVVARGAAPQNANVYIYDPASNTDYTVLDQYYNDGYYVYEIIVY